jgi:hypothetical protein
MNSPVIEEYRFYWPFPWRELAVCAGLCVLAIAIGMGLGAVAEQVALATDSLFPACLIGLFAVSIGLVGFVGLFYVAEQLSCYSLGSAFDDGLVMVYVRPEHIWIYRGVELFPKTDVIAYPQIAWVKNEHTPRGKRCIRIVYGSQLKTAFIAELQEADFEVLLGLLKERCPAAFIPYPPVGYVPSPYPQTTPPQDHLATDPNSAHVFPYGPKVYRDFVFSTFLTFIGIALVGMFCCAAMIMGVRGALSVPLGSGALFFGFGFICLVWQSRWMRLLRVALRGERRGELHLTAQGITLFDLIKRPEPTRIAFDIIRAIRCEPLLKTIWIVGSSECDTVTISQRSMEGVDYETLLAQLKELHPEAFASPLRMFSFGPTLRRRALFASFEVVPFTMIFGGAIWLLVESLSWGGWWIILSIYCILTILNGLLWACLLLSKWRVLLPRPPGILIITSEALTILLDTWVRQIPFRDIRYITSANCRGIERLWIVYGASLITDQFSQKWFTAADYAELVSLLRASVPEAFNPDPPNGWNPPKYSRYPAFDLCE